ncbi:MAG: L,D-transpeptidase family protein [Verrucomicrobia bacterium]|nr:L,D-transpeptidase family protein [Verrucomicrobiota bacterium]MDA1085923.1 L,D-transpeptidase family protein [Verrucomicrobiota bacterium]
MKVKDFDELAYPRRRPWWILLLLVVVVAFFGLRRKNADEPNQPGPREEIADVEAVANEPAAERPVHSEPKAAPPAPLPTGDLNELIARGDSSLAAGELSEARAAYVAALRRCRNASLRREIEDRLGPVHVDLVMNPHMMPEKVPYVVRPGDSVDRLAKKYGVTKDLIIQSNRIANPNLIKAGDQLRILKAKFNVTVSKSRNDLRVEMNERFFKRYRIGTGEFGKTPVGTFVIDLKQTNPDWWAKGKRVRFGEKENILGTRWMSIKASGETPKVSGYGIHGTWDDSTIGKALSAGCIRMRNPEVEELYVLLPIGTPVTINE